MRYLLSVFIILIVSLYGSTESVCQQELTIPMRDGMKLAADIYLPIAGATQLPCIVIRAPNGRQEYSSLYAPLAKEGYAVLIQDTRSKQDPEGKTLPYLADGWGDLQDGFDTLQWLYNSPYCNGKIGTVGISAQGITQLLLAPTRPPGLVCQHIGVAAASVYDHAIFHGGQLLKHQVEGWLGYYAPHPSVLEDVLARSDVYWGYLDTMAKASQVNVPAVHHGGWYDTFLEGTIQGFLSRQHEGDVGARGMQKLVIGPWTHFWPLQQELGDFSVPEAGRNAPVDFSPQRWFAHYLKGTDNGAERIPTVTYYVMGPFDGSPSSGNVWRTADSWPPPADQTAFYLGKDHTLSEDNGSQSSLTFQYDPANPVPTLGGRNLIQKAGPIDQRPIEDRSDVLVFTSKPFESDMEITGPLWAEMMFSTDQSDTDIVVRVTDVYPDGRSILITDGVRRLSDSVEEGDLSDKHHVLVDLSSTSIVIAKGHCLRVSVSSSNYPRYDRNPNCLPSEDRKPPYPVAKNTVYLGGINASRIILPVIKPAKARATGGPAARKLR